MEQNQESNKAKFHLWSVEEDKVLVDCLVTLRMEQKFMAENGFKPGYANALQTMIEEKLPGCGIKAHPHIISRIKTMKLLWQIVYDMVYGTNTSGFGWDSENKCVTAEKDVWDEYVKVHKKAAPFRNKAFPHFENLCFVWAKDRAAGLGGRSSEGMEEDVRVEDYGNPESPALGVADVALSQAANETATNTVPTTEVPTIEVSSSSRKRRRTHNSELVDVLRETVTSLDRTIVRVFENLGNRMSRQGRQAALDAKAADLYIELLGVEGLTINELNEAHIKIVESEQLLTAFDKVPAEFKPSWIRSLLKK